MTFNVLFDDVENAGFVYFLGTGIKITHSRGMRRVVINGLEWLGDDLQKWHQDPFCGLLAGLDFDSVSIVSLSAGAWGYNNFYNFPSVMRPQITHIPGGGCDGRFLLELESSGFSLPNRFQNVWNVKTFEFDSKTDWHDPDVWTALIAKPPKDSLQLANLNWGYWKHGSSPYSGGFVPFKNTQREYFAVVAERTATFPAGQYEIKTNCDDGARVFIDEKLVLDAWKVQDNRRKATQVRLEGEHRIKIEYFQGWGGAYFQFALNLIDSGEK